MKVLVTGGAGFIGSHVVEAYLARGHQVLVLDDLSSGHRENLPSGVPLEEAGVTDAAAVERVVADFKPDLINHHAAQINVRRSVDDPAFDATVNILGLIALCQAAVRHGVPRFIFASSGGAIYGEQETYPADEDHATNPLSPYGVAKLAGEKYLHYYRANWGLDHAILRYANVYGPRQDPHGEAGVVAIFLTLMLDGSQPIINGDGEQTRDYIYVGDVAAANMAVSDDGVRGVFNVGTGRETSVNELYRRVSAIAGGGFPEVHGPAKKGEQRRSSIDAGLLGVRTGWRPMTPLDAGLERTYHYFKGQRAKR